MKTILVPLALLALTGCEVSGTMRIPGEGVMCSNDNDQISVVYQTNYVPNYLTISVNNDQFVFDECAPSSTQDAQAEFQIRRGMNTEIQLGLHHGTAMRDAYFPGGSLNPYRSDIAVRIMGRNSCYVSPTTLVPTTSMSIGWQPQAPSTCSDDGWIGAAVIN